MRVLRISIMMVAASCMLAGVAVGAMAQADRKIDPALKARIVSLVAKLGPGHVNTDANLKGWGEGSEANEAAAELARIGEPVVEYVLPVLKDKVDWRRGLALEVLEHVLDRRAVLPACEVLRNDPSEGVRGRAAELLGLLKDRRATAALVGGLRDKEDHVRARSAEALGRLKDPRTAQALIQLIGTENAYEMARSWQPAQKGVDALVEIGAPALPALRQALTSPNEITRSNAAIVLGRLGDKASADTLLAMLNDVRHDRKQALLALGRIGDHRVAARLIHWITPGTPELLRRSQREDLSDAAVEALGALGDPAAVRPLLALLGKSDWNQAILGRALGQTKDPRVIEPMLARAKLLGAYGREDLLLGLVGFPDQRIDAAMIENMKAGDGYIKWRMIEALVARGSKTALPALEDLLLNSPANDYSTYQSAAVAIGKIDHARLLPLLSSPQVRVRMGAIHAFAKTGKPEEANLITQFLDDAELRTTVIYAIGDLKPPNGLALVTPFLEHKDRYIRIAAVIVIDRLQVAERTARLRANVQSKP